MLCPPSQCSELGDVQVSLCYSPTLQRLSVVVVKARGLQPLTAAGRGPRQEKSVSSVSFSSFRRKSVRTSEDEFQNLWDFSLSVASHKSIPSSLLITHL